MKQIDPDVSGLDCPTLPLWIDPGQLFILAKKPWALLVY